MLRKIQMNELGSIREQWNLLAEHIFQDFDWIDTYMNTIAGNREPLILIDEDKDAITGIAPLMITKRRFYRIIEFIGTPLSDYSDVLSADKPDFLKKVFLYLKENTRHNDIVRLTEIPDKSPTASCCQEISLKLGLHAVVQKANECYSLDVSRSKEPTKYYDKKDIRRHTRSLKKLGSIEVSRCSPKKCKNILKIMGEQHRLKWNQLGFKSMFEDEHHVQFFENLLKICLKKKAELWVLNIDERPIAIEMGFVYGNSYLSFCHSIDLDYQRYSPGLVLLSHVIKNYVNAGVHIIDLSRGAEKYKNRFTNRMEVNVNAIVTKSRAIYLLLWLYGHIRQVIINIPKLHNWIFKYKARFQNP